MIALKKITFAYSESPRIEKGKCCYTWGWAAFIVRRAARYAPVDGSYYKTDLVVEWEDGSVRKLQLDIQWRHAYMINPVGDELRRFLRFWSGGFRPGWMTDEKYQFVLNTLPYEFRGKCAKALIEYDLGPEEVK